jgi:spermidine/putrescine-binding protein
MDSLLGEKEVKSSQTRVMAQKGSIFWFDCWTMLKFL